MAAAAAGSSPGDHWSVPDFSPGPTASSRSRRLGGTSSILVCVIGSTPSFPDEEARMYHGGCCHPTLRRGFTDIPTYGGNELDIVPGAIGRHVRPRSPARGRHRKMRRRFGYPNRKLFRQLGTFGSGAGDHTLFPLPGIVSTSHSCSGAGMPAPLRHLFPHISSLAFPDAGRTLRITLTGNWFTACRLA